MISYKTSKEFDVEQIRDLFLSVNWDSGKYPEKVVRGLRNSSAVISAWDGDKLIGLVRSLDDGETVAFLHYLLVDPEYQGEHIGNELMERILDGYKDFLHIKIMPSDPKTISFYEKFGFKRYDNYSALEIKRF